MHRTLFHMLVTTVVVSVLGTAATASAASPGPSPESEVSAQAAERAVQAELARATVVVPESPPAPEAAQPAPPPPPTDCAAMRGADIPRLVADIFRCRLAQAGFPPGEIDRIAAEAVIVAQCESNYDPSAVVFGGRHVASPHPRTGMFYTAAGIFQFIRERADQWVAGGYANVHDPAANIDAAARLYLHNRQRGYRGWADWACAAANDGFQDGSVLPGWPGGPAELPAWATQY